VGSVPVEGAAPRRSVGPGRGGAGDRVRLLRSFRWDAGWTGRPVPLRTQIGGVARASGPCPVSYRRIDGSGAQAGVGPRQ
jgi:hypothetical protein